MCQTYTPLSNQANNFMPFISDTMFPVGVAHDCTGIVPQSVVDIAKILQSSACWVNQEQTAGASCYTFEDFVSDVSGITPSEEGMDAVNRLANDGGFESPDIQSAIAQAWDMRDWCYAS